MSAGRGHRPVPDPSSGTLREMLPSDPAGTLVGAPRILGSRGCSRATVSPSSLLRDVPGGRGRGVPPSARHGPVAAADLARTSLSHAPPALRLPSCRRSAGARPAYALVRNVAGSGGPSVGPFRCSRLPFRFDVGSKYIYASHSSDARGRVSSISHPPKETKWQQKKNAILEFTVKFVVPSPTPLPIRLRAVQDTTRLYCFSSMTRYPVTSELSWTFFFFNKTPTEQVAS